MKLKPPTNLREIKTRTCSNCEYCILVDREIHHFSGPKTIEKENGCKRNADDDFELLCSCEEIERFVCDGFKWKSRNNTSVNSEK
ncbi:hypothetical protein GNP80_03680 [Aliivibrio fischeri]|uniref:hypothetical protein n=1 Tax=Aliivibrio fischeri TaxID=668 RepID=UPI0012D94DAB|nr:hypothetical protein [Aliivibrio fischeri]MUK91551.1 hypothetical protein [Aliivibrio fischeri]